jgi:ATP-dependent DNA ligase
MTASSDIPFPVQLAGLVDWAAPVSRIGSPSFFGIVLQYIDLMLWHTSRGRPLNAPAAFIHPCQPIVAKQAPTGPGWAHELKHDGYRLQIHARDGRVRLYTINGADWSKRYPLIMQDAARIKGSAILDAEVVCLDQEGMAVFDALHSRVNDGKASACGFDLLMLNGEDLRRQPYGERKAVLDAAAVPQKFSQCRF